jgi:hypothetical protein
VGWRVCGSTERERTIPATPSPSTPPRGSRPPDWERQSAAAGFEQVADLLAASEGSAARLTRAQKGQFVAVCWTAQIYHRIPEPKAAYAAPWEDLPLWQRETDADIFEAIEQAAKPGSLLERG